MTLRARMAPTPSGFLHWGNLLNFALTWVYVRREGGELALRIDDVDATRARTDYVDDIFTTLNWLGFDWDHGPQTSDEFQKKFSQSARTEEYRLWFSKFPGYACACSRQEVRDRTDKRYDGFCRHRGLSLEREKTQWRLLADIPEHDIVLWRKEDLPAYHLVSLFEDLRFGSNLIIRGEDLMESTVSQKYLASMLGRDGQNFLHAHFVHHKLLFDEHGHKLSKSDGADALKSWRERGKSAADVFIELSRRAGWPTIHSLQEILEKGIIA